MSFPVMRTALTGVVLAPRFMERTLELSRQGNDNGGIACFYDPYVLRALKKDVLRPTSSFILNEFHIYAQNQHL